MLWYDISKKSFNKHRWLKSYFIWILNTIIYNWYIYIYIYLVALWYNAHNLIDKSFFLCFLAAGPQLRAELINLYMGQKLTSNAWPPKVSAQCKEVW